MRKWTWLLALALILTLGAGHTLAAKGGKKPPGGDEDPPAEAAPEIAYFDGTDLQVMDGDGANQTLVLAEAGQYHVSWAGDGGRLAFQSTDSLLGAGIWVVDKSGTGLTQAFDAAGGYAVEPAWSAPTSAAVPEKIVFRYGAGLWLMDPSGDNLQPLTSDADRNEAYPAWSPDGIRFAVMFLESEQVTNSDGSTQRVITRAGLEIYTLAFDADGLASIVGAPKTIASVTTDEQAGTDAADVQFTWLDWSPDGRYLAYVDYDEATEQNDLWVVDLADEDDPEFTQLTDTTGAQEYSPSWSPDGTNLVFDRQGRRKDTGLYTVELSTGTETNLGAKAGRFPDWMP